MKDTGLWLKKYSVKTSEEGWSSWDSPHEPIDYKLSLPFFFLSLRRKWWAQKQLLSTDLSANKLKSLDFRYQPSRTPPLGILCYPDNLVQFIAVFNVTIRLQRAKCIIINIDPYTWVQSYAITVQYYFDTTSLSLFSAL